MTKEQIEQKKQQLKQLSEEIKQLTDELKEAGELELSEDEADQVSGGVEMKCGFVPLTPEAVRE